MWFRDRVLALWYLSGEAYALDALTLESLGADDFAGTLPCRMSAHAKVDERTGELLFFDYGPVPPYMRYGVIGPTGIVTHLVEIELPGARLPHDMAATEHYSILMDLPLVADVEAAGQGRHKIVFDNELPARIEAAADSIERRAASLLRRSTGMKPPKRNARARIGIALISAL